MNQRLQQQLEFLLEIDKLKLVKRQTRLVCDQTRQENDAEHSWHLALYVMILKEYANEPDLDWFKVLKLVLIHDLVEIYAGDVFVYDMKMREGKKQREQEAADKLFALLPDDQAQEFHALWQEFEDRVTPESRFAAVVDRMQPFLHNLHHHNGGTWKIANATRAMEAKVMTVVGNNSHVLGEFIEQALNDAVAQGLMLPDAV